MGVMGDSLFEIIGITHLKYVNFSCCVGYFIVNKINCLPKEYTLLYGHLRLRIDHRGTQGQPNEAPCDLLRRHLYQRSNEKGNNLTASNHKYSLIYTWTSGPTVFIKAQTNKDTMTLKNDFTQLWQLGKVCNLYSHHRNVLLLSAYLKWTGCMQV